MTKRHNPKTLFQRLCEEAKRGDSQEKRARMVVDALTFSALAMAQSADEAMWEEACQNRWAYVQTLVGEIDEPEDEPPAQVPSPKSLILP